jgi:carbonic anhydrase
MSELTRELIEGNKSFQANEWDPEDARLEAKPAKKLAVLACMDTRHAVERVLGLKHGDAKIIRNAGNWLDDGALRSLVVAVHLLGVENVAIMGHTQCGMTKVGRGEFRIAHSIAERTPVPLHEVMRPGFQRWLGGITDVEEHVRRSTDLVRNHPYIPDDVQVFGIVYDNETGTIRILEKPQVAERPMTKRQT